MRIEGECVAGVGHVRIDGRILEPGASQRLVNHSPDGFAWGYGGSGPAQLALAILLEAGVDAATANGLHQAFKWAFLANVPADRPLRIEVDVEAWVRQQTRGGLMTTDDLENARTLYRALPTLELKRMRQAFILDREAGANASFVTGRIAVIDAILAEQPPATVDAAADLHDRVRAMLVREFAREPALALATALAYELASITATVSESTAEAADVIMALSTTMLEQINAFGVGKPHP